MQDNLINLFQQAFPNSRTDIEKVLSLGKIVILADGSTRKIIKTEERRDIDSFVIHLDGDALDGEIVGWPNSVCTEATKKIISIVPVDNENSKTNIPR